MLTTLLLMICLMSLGYGFGRHRVKREWSYHFYLYHMVIINFVVHSITNKARNIDEMLLLFVITFTVTLIFTWISGCVVDGVLVKRIQ